MQSVNEVQLAQLEEQLVHVPKELKNCPGLHNIHAPKVNWYPVLHWVHKVADEQEIQFKEQEMQDPEYGKVPTGHKLQELELNAYPWLQTKQRVVDEQILQNDWQAVQTPNVFRKYPEEHWLQFPGDKQIAQFNNEHV